MNTKTVLFVLTSTPTIGPDQVPCGYEFSEVAHPYLVFTAHGMGVEFASVEGGRPPEHGFDPDDLGSAMFRAGKGFADLKQSRPIAEIPTERYAALFFPGGLGPMVDLVTNQAVKAAVAAFHESGRIVGAVCHGPAALLNVILTDGANFLQNRRVTAFSTAEEIGQSEFDVPFMLDAELARQGAIPTAALPFQKHIEVDEQLITGQNPASAAGVAEQMVRLIENVGVSAR